MSEREVIQELQSVFREVRPRNAAGLDDSDDSNTNNESASLTAAGAISVLRTLQIHSRPLLNSFRAFLIHSCESASGKLDSPCSKVPI